jgi:hypothetical protein
MRVNTLRITAVAAIGALAACSGGGGSAVPPSTHAMTAPAAPAGATRAALTVVVPRPGASAGSSTRRMPRYVSPSSAALQVAVNGAAATTYGLTPQSPGCVVQAGNLTCTFAIAAPVGSDTLALTLVDGAGSVLSRNVVTATLAAGATTPVAVTLAGVPASVVVVPGANAVVDSTTAPYRAPGLFPQPVEVEPLDADGNIIIGPGAPTITSVSVTSGAAYASIASANTTDPAAYRLTPVDATAGGKTVQISATVQGVPLADGTTSQPLTNTTAYLFTPAIALAGGPFVSIYSVESHAPITHFSVCGGGCSLTIATGIQSDAKGNLYALYATFSGLTHNTTVDVFPPGRTSPSYVLGTSQGLYGTAAIAVKPDGTLYAANAGNGGFHQVHHPSGIAIFAPGTTTGPTSTIGGTTTTPQGIAVDAAGNIFLGDQTGTISEYPPGSQTASATLSDPSLASAGPLAIDASGGLYAADTTNGDIAYFAPGQTALTNTLFDQTFSNGLGGLMFDPAGNLWVFLGGQQQVESLAAGALPNAVSVSDTIFAGGSPAWIP